MKKLFFLMLGSLLAFASCNNDEGIDNYSVDNQSFSMTVGMPATRALDMTKGGVANVDPASYSVRFILEAYNSDGTFARRFVRYEDLSSGVSTTFNMRLLPKEYTFAAWADFVDKSSATPVMQEDASDEGAVADNYYITTGSLKAVAIDGTKYAASPDYDKGSRLVRDAYCGTTEVDLASSGKASLTLKRPFGRIDVVATDLQSFVALNAGTLGDVTVTYTEIPSTYNVYAGDIVDGATIDNASFTITVPAYTTESEIYLSYDYIFAPATGQGNAGFKMAVATDDATQVSERELQAIPVEHNKITRISGAVLTTNSSLNIDIDDEFDPDGRELSNVVTVASIAEAMADGVISAEGVLHPVVEQLNVTGQISAVTTIKIAESVTDGTRSFNFAGGIADGTTVTLTDEAGQFEGIVEIHTPAASTGNITATYPKATVKTYGGIGTLTATTAPTTLMIGKSSTVAALVLKGGSAEIYGKVGDFTAQGTATDIVTVFDTGDITGAGVNTVGTKVYWKASNGARLVSVLAKAKEYNHGVTLTGNVWATPATLNGNEANQSAFIIGDPDGRDFDTGKATTNPYENGWYNGYVFDGAGFTMSGFAWYNVMIVKANDVTVKDLTIKQSATDKTAGGGRDNNGLSVYQSLNVTLENVTVLDTPKAGVVVNGGKVTATGLKTSGNAWGGVNVSRPSGGGGVKPEFTFDATSTFGETAPVYVDMTSPSDSDWTVNYPSGEGWTAVYNNNASKPQTYIVQSVAGIISSAAAGSTVTLKATNYQGPLTIDKELTIEGVPGTTITGTAGTAMNISNVVNGNVKISGVDFKMTGATTGKPVIDLVGCDNTTLDLTDTNIVLETAANDNRGISISGNSSGTTTTVNLNNVHMGNSTEVLGRWEDDSNYTDADIQDTQKRVYNRGINIGQNDGKVVVNINGSVLEKVTYGINVTGSSTVAEVNIANSTIDSWAPLNIWGASTGNVYNITNSNLIGRNYYAAGSSNDFANIVINEDAENNTVNITDSRLVMFTRTTNEQYVGSFRSTLNNIVNIKGNSTIYDHSQRLDYLFDVHTGSGTTLNIDPTVQIVQGKAGAKFVE